MTKFIACLLLVENDEDIRQLLRTSLPMDKSALLEATSLQEVWMAVAASGTALLTLDVALSRSKEGMLMPQPQDGMQPQATVVTVHGQEKSSGRRLTGGVKGRFRVKAVREEAAQAGTTAQTAAAQIFRVRDLTIDQPRRVVTLAKDELHLTPTEYELLCLLAAQKGAVLPHGHLMRAIWGVENEHTVHLLRVNISNLRRKLNAGPSGPPYITTEPGIGYRLRSDG